MRLGGQFIAAFCALFHMMFSVIGIHPNSAALMCAGAGGGDGFGLRFILADGAFLMPGTRFGGGWFLIDDPAAVVMGGFIFDGVDVVVAVGSGAGVPVVGGVGCPCVTKGVGVGDGGGGNGNSHILMPFDTINSAFSAITDFDLCVIDLKICPPIGLTH